MSDAERPFFLPEICTVSAALVLVLLAELLALVLALVASPGVGLQWQDLAMISLFVQWVVLGSASLLCALRRPLARLPTGHGAAISLLLVMGVALLTSLTGQCLPGAGGPALAAGSPGIDVGRVLEHLVIAGIVAGIALRYGYVQQQLQLQREAELRARIEALQARIRPHFLFNSMNSIASLIATSPQLAEDAVEDLADLFRQSLAAGGPEIELTQELELCRRFARIEGLRLGERLRVHWAIGDLPSEQRIPPFTLQPLLENAIYHGIGPLPEGGLIRVSARGEGRCCVLEITNPVVAGGSRNPGNRLALDNIRHRLQACYGGAGELRVAHGAREFMVRVTYPLAVGSA